MLRKLTYAVIVAGISVSFAMAQAPTAQPGGVKQAPLMWGKITKVSPTQVIFQPYDPATQKFGEAKTFTITPTQQIQVFQMQGDKRVPVTGGLNAEMFKTVPETGLFTSVQVQGPNLNSIQLYPNQNTWMQGMKAVPVPPGGGK